MKKLLFTPLVGWFIVTIFTLSFGLLTSPLLYAAQTLEDQIKPYGIKMEDLQAALNEPEYQNIDNVYNSCTNTVLSLSSFHSCLTDKDTHPIYSIVSNRDSSIWRILQVTSKGLLIQDLGADIAMVEGITKGFDGQAFSSKRYLLKYVGTFQYTNTLGSTSTVPKLKLIKELKIN